MAPRPDPVTSCQPAWLLLVYQLPSRPSNARVKTWRRLQKLGALAIRNSAYALPHSPQAREDFEWLKAEILAMKGQADVFAADTIDPLAAYEITAAFRRERQRDFGAIRREAGELLGRISRAPASSVRRRLARVGRALHGRWAEAAALDFFGAAGRDESAAALDQLDRALTGEGRRQTQRPTEGGLLMPEKFRNRIWLTRPRAGIDRMSSAWLIRRFIDSRARFRFAEKPEKSGGSVPFDMFGVEFSHQGNFCTFETLVRRFKIQNVAVDWLGQIVHDIDLKDDRYGVADAPAIARLVDGLRQMYADDNELLDRGIALFEALYRSYEDHPGGKARTASRRRPLVRQTRA